MSASYRQNVSEMYQFDIERHLFAPAPRRARRRGHRLDLDPLAEWVRGWLLAGWYRWKVQVMDLG